ncbi:hypothetical protein I4U23_018536 [Adineta vaga]|nr:hypothetical protein I4U23_018536 [Adineta vaga]
MNSSSPPVLYLDDDDDDDDDDDGVDHIYRASSSNDMRLPRKKRKLTNTNVQINPSVVNWSKRQRNDHFHRQPSQNMIDAEFDPEPVLLDPEEYIIEEPDTHSFCSFDWTIQTRPPLPPPPPPPPPPLLSTRIRSSPIQTTAHVSSVPPLNVNYATKRYVDKPDRIPNINSHERIIQQPRKPSIVPASASTPPTPRPSLSVLTLPLPKPTSSIARPNTRRGRPLKNSRVLHTKDTSPPSLVRHRPEPQLYSQVQQAPRLSSTITPTPTVASSSSNNLTSEIRRQILNGTGLFSAFHDTKYYQCNICKFKSVTSSTLLQHLFTHMFFCDQCSFYSYSHYTLTQHVYEKHTPNVSEHTHDSSNPKSFDLLYITRCSDGTFALCMDSSLSPTTTTTTALNKVTTNDHPLIISSAVPNDQQQNQSLKKKLVKQKSSTNEENNDIVLLSSEKHDTTNHRPVTQTKTKEKPFQNYISIKHRRVYSLKKPFSFHTLTLEYDLCRENMIRLMCNTQSITKRRSFLEEFHKTRLIDEVADCLRIIVNDIVDSEDNSAQSSLICKLPNRILSSIFSVDNLDIITHSLKLNNKYEYYQEQKTLYDREHIIRENRKNIFVLSSPDANHNEQSIISSLHSSMTNGDSVFTQTKVDRTPSTSENTRRYAQRNSNVQSQVNHSKPIASKKMTAIQSSPPSPLPPSPRIAPIHSVIPKTSRSQSNPSILDRNNNTIPTPHPKVSPSKHPNVIILD